MIINKKLPGKLRKEKEIYSVCNESFVPRIIQFLSQKCLTLFPLCTFFIENNNLF